MPREAVAFRWLLVIGTSAYILFFFTPAFPLQLPPDIASLRSQNGYGATIASLPWFPWLFLLAIVTSSVGMFFFKAWARALFLVLYLAVLLLRLIQGMTVHLPIEGFLSEVVSLADGAVLALAFTKPVESLFARGPSE